MPKITSRKLKKHEHMKVKLKGSKTYLPKGQNVTDTNFKVKKVVIRDQVHPHKEGEILNKKNLSCQELISRLTHHNFSLKHDGLSGLKELLTQRPKPIIESNLAKLIESISKLTLDESTNIRKDAKKLIAVILSQVSVSQIAPLYPLMSSYLVCGLTHIDCSVREDSLFFLDTLLKHTPELCANSVAKLLPICLDLVSSGNTGPRTLSLNLESKLTSGKWRISVLARISALLLIFLNSSKECELKCQTLPKKIVQFANNGEHKSEKYYIYLRDENLNYNYDENRILFSSSIQLCDPSKEFNFKEFSEALVPLLFEAFIELMPVEKNIINNDTSTYISSETALLLKNITNIIHVLWNLCNSSNKPHEDKEWIRNKFGKSFKNSLIDGRYPYSLITSTKELKKKKSLDSITEFNELPSNHAQNILLAKLLIALTDSIHWKPAIVYLKGCLRMVEPFSVDESSVLVSCFYQICCSNSENTQDFLSALQVLSNSKNNHLSSLAFNALHSIAIDSNLSHLHNDDNFTSWLDSLPEKLIKPAVSTKVLDMIYDIAKRNFLGFSTSLDGLIEVILDNLAFLKIDGLSEGEGHLKVAQLLYWVKDWDSEMVDALNTGVKSNYWGDPVTFQIRDILIANFQMAFLERRRLNFFDLKENADTGRIYDALGEDENGINPILKVWNIEKFDKNGIPVCLRICRASIPYKADHYPSCIAVTNSLSFMAVGFPDGSILLYRGDIKRERTSKQKLLKDELSSITGLAFHSSAKTTLLYVATINTIEMFDVTYKDKEKRTNLDQDGCSLRCSILVETGQDGHFFVAKNDAVYCYTNGDKGPCYALHGEKVQLEWFRGYLLIIAKDSKSSSRISSSVKSLGDADKYTHELTVLDSQDNSLTVFTSPLQDVTSVLVEWGSFYILSADKSLALVAEKDLQSKLSLLFKKNLYDLAIRIAKHQQYDADGLMEIFRQYGDHLYSKGDHRGAIKQYIKTIGKLEPSYVIRKYLGSQQVENLTTYLQALHKEGAATGGHTTLLLNFYTKLNKPELLKEFIMTKDREVDFDVEVAIDVCRHVSAEDALLLAEKHSLHEWYLTIQIEDQKKYQTALDYIAKLDFEKAEIMIKKYGMTLLENIPEETTQFLKKICTNYHPSDQSIVNQNNEYSTTDIIDGYSKLVNRSSPEDFIHYFLNNSEKLVEFLEHLVETPFKWSPQVYTSLLEHYLQIWGSQNDSKLEQKIMRLLESQDSSVDKLQALILCKSANFKNGLLFLYEQNKMYESILKYHISVGDYNAVVVCCRRFEHQKSGLWIQALWALSSHYPVPSKELTEILQVIERNKLLPPILVIEALSNSPSVKIGNVRPYLKKVVEAELNKKIEQTSNIEKYDTETKDMKKSIEEFKTKPVIFQGSRCSLCKKQLELPSIHFLCQHSFHQQFW